MTKNYYYYPAEGQFVSREDGKPFMFEAWAQEANTILTPDQVAEALDNQVTREQVEDADQVAADAAAEAIMAVKYNE